MSIRVIVRTDDAGMPANVSGGAVETSFKTFEIEAPALEIFLREKLSYAQRQVIGIELVDPTP